MRYAEWISQVDRDRPGRFLLALVEEPFLWETMQRVLREDVLGGQTAFNYEVLDGRTVTPAQFESAVATLPLMAQRRVVVLDHAPLGRDEAKASDALLATIGSVISQHPDQLLLILAYHGKQPFRGKRLKSFEKELTRVSLSRLDDAELAGFISKRYRASGVTVEAGVVARVAESSEYQEAKLQRTLYDVANLVDQTVALAREGRLTLETAEAVLTPPAERNIFALMDAVSDRDVGRALVLFQQYRDMGEDAFRLFYLLVRHVRNLIGAKRAIEANISPRTAEERLNIKSFEYDKLRRAVRHYTVEELLAMHDALYTVEKRVKTEPFRMEPALESFFVHLAK